DSWLHSPDDKFAGPRRRSDILGSRVEVGERPGEHYLAQNRVLPDKNAEGADRGHYVAPGVRGLVQGLEPCPQATETLEEHRAYQAGLVAEELVDRRGRGIGMPGHVAGSDCARPFFGKKLYRYVQYAVTQAGSSQFRSGHGSLQAQSVPMFRNTA